MVTMKFYVEWHGEIAAGIRPGSEDVSITFEHGDYGPSSDCIDPDTMEFWRESLAEYFDGAKVYTQEEYRKMMEMQIDIEEI